MRFFHLVWCFLLLAAGATQARTVSFSTGTGFYVSRQGHLITNAHVLQECLEIRVRDPGLTPRKVEFIAVDEKLDLALLKSTVRPERVLRLRQQWHGLESGEKVTVIGYPGEVGLTGGYKVAFSTVKALDGPMGEGQWLRFEDAARQGNSGGPLLDESANVVGVVTGKVELSRRNPGAARDELVEKSDIAINLHILRDFLKQNRVYYEQYDSHLKLTPRQVEERAQPGITQVLCRQD